MFDSLDRRRFVAASLGAAGALAFRGAGSAHEMINSTFAGVALGVQSYSFRDRDLDAAIAAMKKIGVGECELFSGHVERAGGDREELRRWRLSVDLAEFEAAGAKFHEAGVNLHGFSYNIREDFADGEIERGFEMAKALGAKFLTSSSNVTTAKRIDAFANKHQMRVGMHNHSRIRENEFATPANFDDARKGLSDYIAINLDIGHFVAAGFDPLDYLRKEHDNILALHIKDRKKNQGPNTPFGEGDTPIHETLQLLREEKYDIPANIEYEYRGTDTVVEVSKCFGYCKAAILA